MKLGADLAEFGKKMQRRSIMIFLPHLCGRQIMTRQNSVNITRGNNTAALRTRYPKNAIILYCWITAPPNFDNIEFKKKQQKTILHESRIVFCNCVS